VKERNRRRSTRLPDKF